MSAIAIATLFVVLALASAATIAASMAKGIAAGREIVAELSGAMVCDHTVRAISLPPLRSRHQVTVPKHSRQAVRLRPLRRHAAAA